MELRDLAVRALGVDQGYQGSNPTRAVLKLRRLHSLHIAYVQVSFGRDYSWCLPGEVKDHTHANGKKLL